MIVLINVIFRFSAEQLRMLINNFTLSPGILHVLIKTLASRNVHNININYTMKVSNWSMCNFASVAFDSTLLNG